jgi:KaiC/GvpD/RAD55 family RecA-like ATPase
MALKNTERFEFDVDFQWEILGFILLEKNGYKLLHLLQPGYFDLDHQRVIAHAIQKYFKRKHKVIPTPALLKEELRNLFNTKDYARSFTEKDREDITKRAKRLFRNPPKDPDEIYEKCKTFASFVQFKRTLEEVDITNYGQYEAYLKKFQGAVNIGLELDEQAGTLMVNATRVRLYERHNRTNIHPTPYHALNRLTTAGGWPSGAVIVVVDKPKRGKTLFLVNTALDYAKQRADNTNKVIYFDLENGEDSISLRLDQAISNLDTKEILSGKHDKKLNKLYRQLKRLKSEIFIVRMPAGCTTNDLDAKMDELNQKYGLVFNVAIIDYVALMGALSGKTEDVHRISDAYIDVKNWAKKRNLVHVWTANHVVRQAYKKRLTKYAPDELAKCIDIERHVDALLGIQQSEEDMKMNIMRVEVLEQRHGAPFGRILFKQNLKTQRLKLLSQDEHRDYNNSFGELYNEGSGIDEDVKKFRDSKQKRKFSD